MIGRHDAIYPLLCVVFSVAWMGCSTPSFDITAPPEMVTVDRGDHSFVAMTHDGVVMRGNVYRQGDQSDDIPRGSHEFWTRATRERMRTRGGYALLDEKEVESRDGHPGTQLEFGRDQKGLPYHYWVILFATDDHLHVLEVGGRQTRFDEAKPAIESALNSYVVGP